MMRMVVMMEMMMTRINKGKSSSVLVSVFLDHGEVGGFEVEAPLEGGHEADVHSLVCGGSGCQDKLTKKFPVTNRNYVIIIVNHAVVITSYADNLSVRGIMAHFKFLEPLDVWF